MDELFTENYQHLEKIIDGLANQNLRRSHNNIIDKFASENVSNDLAEEIIQIALEKDLISSYKYSQQINYKIKSITQHTETNDLTHNISEVFEDDDQQLDAAYNEVISSNSQSTADANIADAYNELIAHHQLKENGDKAKPLEAPQTTSALEKYIMMQHETINNNIHPERK